MGTLLWNCFLLDQWRMESSMVHPFCHWKYVEMLSWNLVRLGQLGRRSYRLKKRRWSQKCSLLDCSWRTFEFGVCSCKSQSTHYCCTRKIKFKECIWWDIWTVGPTNSIRHSAVPIIWPNLSGPILCNHNSCINISITENWNLFNFILFCMLKLKFLNVIEL